MAQTEEGSTACDRGPKTKPEGQNLIWTLSGSSFRDFHILLEATFNVRREKKNAARLLSDSTFKEATPNIG